MLLLAQGESVGLSQRNTHLCSIYVSQGVLAVMGGVSVNAAAAAAAASSSSSSSSSSSPSRRRRKEKSYDVVAAGKFDAALDRAKDFLQASAEGDAAFFKRQLRFQQRQQVRYYTVLYSALLCSALLCSAPTLLYSTLLYSTLTLLYSNSTLL